MDPQTLRIQCREMSDETLVRALTVDRDDYAPEFRDAASHEMFRRGFSLAEYTDHILVRRNNEPETESGIAAALARLPEVLELWEAWFFTNCLKETFFFQKETSWISVHFRANERPPKSYFLESETGLKSIVERFLRLEDWEEGLTNEIFLEAWPIVAESDSSEYIRMVAAKLADRDIPAAVKSLGLSGCACGGGILKILVPPESEEKTREVLAELEQETARLYEEAESLSDDADPSWALTVYQHLSVLAPDDALVHFNYGTLLYEAGQPEAAADAFTRAAFADPGNQEILQNCVDYLKDIAEQLSENVELRHTLATLLIRLGAAPEEIEPLYLQILQRSPDDSVAHLNLGYLYYQNEGKDALAREHFRKYLDVVPEAEDREHIEAILRELSVNAS